MNVEHDNFWFIIIWLVGLCFLGAIMFIGASILFGANEKEDTIENYNDCLLSEIPPRLCDLIYPPLNIQGINWTWIPFP